MIAGTCQKGLLEQHGGSSALLAPYQAGLATPRARRRLAAPRRKQRPVPVPLRIHIDRRAHMELAWQRQAEREALLLRAPQLGEVVEVQDLAHLERINEQAGSQLVVLCLYTRSCGTCKNVLQNLDKLAAEAHAQRIRAIFARHNIINEFDFMSDISRFYGIRAVPAFVFYMDGAVVRRLTLRDVRRLAGPAAHIQRAVETDLARLRSVFQEVVLTTAPSAGAAP